jgi:probable rRNA maturation factor
VPVDVAWGVAREAFSRPGDELPSDEQLARAAEAALARGGRAGLELALVLVDDATLAELHGRFLGDPTPTDVLAFDLGDGPGPAGEVYVSVERARAVAGRRGLSSAREVCLYVVHGCLHLCGFDDAEDEPRAAMRAAEREVLGALGHAPDEASHEER